MAEVKYGSKSGSGFFLVVRMTLFFLVSMNLIGNTAVQALGELCRMSPKDTDGIARLFIEEGRRLMKKHFYKSSPPERGFNVAALENPFFVYEPAHAISEEERLKNIEIDKKTNATINAQKFQEGKSCIDGSDPPTEKEVKAFVNAASGHLGPNQRLEICDPAFDHKEVNKRVSKEFGHRCINKKCHVHHKRGSFVCSSTSNQAMILLVAAAILLLELHSAQYLS